MLSRVLVIVPLKPSLHPDLRCRAFTNAEAIAPANPELRVTVLLDSVPEPSQPDDNRPWSKVARVRNRILEAVSLDSYDHVCWIDADVIRYDPGIITSLIRANQSGVSAPMVMIDGTEHFYDTAAFVMLGKSHIDPHRDLPFTNDRQLIHTRPYWPQEPTEDVVAMDCVGTFYVVNTVVLRACEHPVFRNHLAFTDHHHLCRTCREMERSVTVTRSLTVAHASLPSFGEAWH